VSGTIFVSGPFSQTSVIKVAVAAEEDSDVAFSCLQFSAAD